jgi:hypothetical protein
MEQIHPGILTMILRGNPRKALRMIGDLVPEMSPQTTETTNLV